MEAWKKVEQKLLDLYEEGDVIVSGGCPKGADRFAEKFAKNEGAPILIIYPNYKKFGRGAPIIRNGSVANSSDVIVACVVNPQDGLDEVLKRKTGGTEDTLRKFCKRVEDYDKRIILV